uniref:Uncharacterized protein n=1 Tax=Opuntia streptacantha TaxID=393608 RepID=A0A7C9EVH6_OPUST
MLILTFSHTRAFQIAAFQLPRHIIRLIIKVLMLHTLITLSRQGQTTPQLQNTIQAAQTGMHHMSQPRLLKYTTMTATTRSHLRRLLTHRRQRDSQLVHWHLMRYLLQLNTSRKHLSY